MRNILLIATSTVASIILADGSSAQTAAPQTPEVVVEAPHVQATKEHGTPALSIVYKINYADLNLGTHSGAVELEKRIKDSATKACAQLEKLYPDLKEPQPSCVKSAVKNAMAQANKAIAAAETAKK